MTSPYLAADEQGHRSVWQAVRERAERQPDVVAVRWPGGHLTYAELCCRAARLSWHLSRLGIGPESVVAVCPGRSGHMLVALFGVLAAGGAFLPIDAAVPAERRRLMLEDSRAAAVLTAADSGLDPAGLTVASRPLVRLDADWPAIAAHHGTPPPDRAAPGNLAYVIYTSGSTGRPKGVMVSRAGLDHYLTWCAHRYPIAAGHRVPVHSALGVDLTITSLFPPLLAGATLDLLPDGPGGLELLADSVAAGAADFIKLTPPHLRAIEARLGGALPDHRVTLVVGGEALFERDLAPWAGRAQVFNEYGPTEAVVGCSVAEWVPDPDASGGTAVDIGRPVPHALLTVLDAAGEEVPGGSAGELSIGGPALARGYLGSPAATAAAFRPDPYTTVPGARAYRSGDRVRWRSTGHQACLDYLGRMDRQLKIDGHRVEPGEIESALCGLPAVTAAVVRQVRSRAGRRLVAYLAVEPAPAAPCLAGAGPLAPDALRRALAERLPEHMVPSVFVLLPRLPTTPGGKTDLAALPDPDQIEAAAEPAELETDRQRQVARIWCEVLEVDQIGADSDFFALGGQSLAAARVVTRLRANAGVQLRLDEIFCARTVAELAALIDSRSGRSHRPVGRADSTPLTVPVGELTDAEVEEHLNALLAEAEDDR